MIGQAERKRARGLLEAARASRRRLRKDCERRQQFLSQYGGTFYGPESLESRPSIPVNMIRTLIQTYTAHLSPNNPQVLITTRKRQYKATALDLEESTNRDIVRIDLETTLRSVLIDALFMMGIAKTGLRVDGFVNFGETDEPLGKVFCLPVSFDDYFFDYRARTDAEMAFEGDRYFPRISALEDMGVIDPDDLRKMAAAFESMRDDEGYRRALRISMGDDSGYGDDLEDRAEVYDIFDREQGVVWTVPNLDDWDRPLRIMEWTGPRDGPYTKLRFNTVPDQYLPISHVAHGMDLHLIVNQLFRKVTRQALRQKNVNYAMTTAREDAERVVDGPDGETVYVTNPASVQSARFPGADNVTALLTVQFKDLFNEMMGNLSLLAGTAAASPTATQDELLSKSASLAIEDCARTLTGFVEKVCRQIAWYRFHEPLEVVRSRRRVAGTTLYVDTEFGPDTDKGDWMDYDLHVAPYSMSYRTPQAQLAKMFAFLDRIAPHLPMMAQQNAVLVYEEFVRLFQRYADFPEAEDLVKFMETERRPVDGGGREEGIMRKSPVSRRVYVREGRPGTTDKAHGQLLQQKLAGANLQPSQEAMI